MAVECPTPCPDWSENFEKLNAPIVIQQIRTGVRYTGEPIRYCPWCGLALVPQKPSSG
jgi:hypothetical protein